MRASVGPRPTREFLRPRGGEPPDVDVRGRVIEIRRAPAGAAVAQTVEGPVPLRVLPPLTDALMRDALDEVCR